MGVGPKDIVLRFLRDAIERAGKAENLTRRVRERTGRLYSPKTITAWARGQNPAKAEFVFGAALALDMSIDEYLGRDREETSQEAIARLDDAVATLQHEVNELRGLVGDLLQERQADEETGEPDRDQAGKVS